MESVCPGVGILQIPTQSDVCPKQRKSGISPESGGISRNQAGIRWKIKVESGGTRWKMEAGSGAVTVSCRIICLDPLTTVAKVRTMGSLVPQKS